MCDVLCACDAHLLQVVECNSAFMVQIELSEGPHRILFRVFLAHLDKQQLCTGAHMGGRLGGWVSLASAAAWWLAGRVGLLVSWLAGRMVRKRVGGQTGGWAGECARKAVMVAGRMPGFRRKAVSSL